MANLQWVQTSQGGAWVDLDNQPMVDILNKRVQLYPNQTITTSVTGVAPPGGDLNNLLPIYQQKWIQACNDYFSGQASTSLKDTLSKILQESEDEKMYKEQLIQAQAQITALQEKMSHMHTEEEVKQAIQEEIMPMIKKLYQAAKYWKQEYDEVMAQITQPGLDTNIEGGF